jgi:DNA-binding NarL/FixJ family response regulator
MVDVKTTSVILADDHESVRRGIRDLLRSAPDIQVIGEAINGIEALKFVEELEPDVLVLDIEMPGMNGIEVARRLNSAGAAVRILVLSAYDDNEYIQEVLQNGVSGYIIKGEASHWLVEAVRGVARGEKGWVSARVSQKLREINPSNPQQFTMTYRELEILRLMAQDLSEKEISTKLNLPMDTFEAQIQKLLNKLGVGTWKDAVEIAYQEGWI